MTLNNDLEDYFFTTTETTGNMVYIFVPGEYPNENAISLTELIINFGLDAFIGIEAEVTKTDPSLRNLPIGMVRNMFY